MSHPLEWRTWKRPQYPRVGQVWAIWHPTTLLVGLCLLSDLEVWSVAPLYMALVLSSILLKLLSDHDEVINTKWPSPVIISHQGWWHLGQQESEKPSKVNSRGLRKWQWFSDSSMRLNHGGGGGTAYQNTLRSLTPRVSDSAGLGGTQGFALTASSQVLLVRGAYIENQWFRRFTGESDEDHWAEEKWSRAWFFRFPEAFTATKTPCRFRCGVLTPGTSTRWKCKSTWKMIHSANGMPGGTGLGMLQNACMSIPWSQQPLGAITIVL